MSRNKDQDKKYILAVLLANKKASGLERKSKANSYDIDRGQRQKRGKNLTLLLKFLRVSYTCQTWNPYTKVYAYLNTSNQAKM